MELNDWFLKGVTAQEYVDSMSKNKESFIYIYEHFKVPTEDEPLFGLLRSKNLRAIILTEDWCGDAMLNIPIFLRLAEKARINTHFLQRDKNLELMDQYLTNGTSRSIPKIIVIDQDGNEYLNWGPRAPEVQKFLDEASSHLPSENNEDFKNKQEEMYQFITKAFRDNEDFRAFVYQDLKEALTN
ncbi:thioredoxin family protein [Halobacillus sp. Marseille-Q1614]|uniref:thioredoxin family protein n=1 Tax=Halobacillus sp. Marseille-Q1614 TaxID=2709134 RepID=UPI00156F66A2|nr:thioredoxin family protein [Halobacillus sp. Marseille-Q1614]